MSNNLTEVDAKGNVQPELAESFEASDGAKKWVFKLRNGVTFHDGKALTPEDVIASIRHHMGEGSKSAAKSLLEAVADIQAEGSERVIFTLKSGNADFPYIVSDYHLPIMPAKDGKADWQSGNRTGPFIFVNFEPGVIGQAQEESQLLQVGQALFRRSRIPCDPRRRGPHERHFDR